MRLNNISVNSQTLYAGLKRDEMEKADCTKNGLNNVSGAGEAEVVVEAPPPRMNPCSGWYD